jgi:hypothetical protein
MWTTPRQPFRVPTPDDAQSAERLVFLSTSTGMPAGRPIEMRLDSVFRSETVKAIDFHPRAPEMLAAMVSCGSSTQTKAKSFGATTSTP